jgi:hypothetical protein
MDFSSFLNFLNLKIRLMITHLSAGHKQGRRLEKREHAETKPIIPKGD